jgi:SH3-like domain-containing protein
MPSLFRLLISVCLILSACLLATPPASAQAVKISQFSGKPVPRFESLRYSAVNGRKGPSRDHEILWRYERFGMPVLIIKETRNWVQVRDADGDEVWVHARMLGETRYVLLLKDTLLRRKAQAASTSRATLQRGVVAELGACDEHWCKIRAGKYEGWVDRPSLWGVQTDTGNL